MKYYICKPRGISSFRSRSKGKYLSNIVGGKRTTRVKEKAAKVWGNVTSRSLVLERERGL
jgi:hypothetical protein